MEHKYFSQSEMDAILSGMSADFGTVTDVHKSSVSNEYCITYYTKTECRESETGVTDKAAMAVAEWLAEEFCSEMESRQE